MPSLITPILKPASVFYSAYASITDLRKRQVVLGKDSTLEIYDVTSEEGLSLRHTLPIHGKLIGLTTFEPLKKPPQKAKPGNSSSKRKRILDWIFLVTDRGSCFLVTYENGSFVQFQDIDLDFEGRALLSSGALISIDPSRNYLALHAYQGYLKVYKMLNRPNDDLTHPAASSERDGSMKPLFHSIVNHNLEFVELTDLKFLPELEGTSLTYLALLTRETDNSCHFSLLALQPNPPKLLKKAPPEMVDFETSFLIPLLDQEPGVLAVSSKNITYFNLKQLDNVTSKTFPLTGIMNHENEEPFTCYTTIDHTRFLLGTQSGALYLLILHLDKPHSHGTSKKHNSGIPIKLDLHPMGKTAPATNLLHLSGNYFFASSHFAHSVLFQIDAKRRNIQPVQEIRNVAPVTDIVNIKEDEGSTSSLIIGSGGFDTGCLKRLKSGQSVDIIAELSLETYIENIWQAEDNTLLITSPGSGGTRIFSVDPYDGSVTEIGNQDFNEKLSSKPTLGYGEIVNMGFYQITSHSIVSLLSGDSWEQEEATSPPFRFAAFSETNIFCSDGLSLKVFDSSLNLISNKVFECEIACIAVSLKEGLCIVGFWKNSSLKLYLSPTLENSITIDISNSNIDNNSLLVRALKFIEPSTGVLYLLVGLADGNVLIYSLNLSSTPTAVFQENIICGTSPVSFFDYKDSKVLVSSSRTSMIEFNEKNGSTIVETVPLNLEHPPICSLSLNNSYFGPDTLLLASNNVIKFASIGISTAVGMQEKYMNEVVYKLEGVPGNPNLLFGATVGLHNHRFVGKIKLFDSVSLEVLDEFDLNENETGQCIVPIISESLGFSGIVLGTCVEEGLHDDDTQEKGRIMLFTVDDKNLKLGLQDKLNVPGTVYDFAFSSPEFTVPSTQFLAAVNNQVLSIQLVGSDVEKKFHLEVMDLQHTYQSPTFLVSLSSYENKVVSGDLLRGGSYSRYENSEGFFDILKEASGALSTSDVELINKDEFLISDVGGLIKKVTIKDHKSKEVSMSYNFASGVNKIRRINPNPSEFKGFDVQPDSYIVTASGGIYLHSTISKPLFDMLISIQQSLPSMVQAVNVSKNMDSRSAYERFRKPYGVIDGELIMGIDEIDVGHLDSSEDDFHKLTKESYGLALEFKKFLRNLKH